MGSKQLVLFKGVDVKKLDTCLMELNYLIFDLKYVALQIEIAQGRSKAFQQTLDLSKVVAKLGYSLSDISLRCIDWSESKWMSLCHYEPYYPAVEPRSVAKLYDLAVQYKSSCNSLILRLRATLAKGAVKPPKEIEQLVKGFINITETLKRESIKL